MNWAPLLHADANLGKLKVTLIIIEWVWSKTSKALKNVGLLNQVHLTNDLLNWAYWLNDFCMLIFACFEWYLILAIWKLCVGKFLAEMLTTDQIAGFFKLWCLKNYLWYNVALVKSRNICCVSSGMPEHVQGSPK